MNEAEKEVLYSLACWFALACMIGFMRGFMGRRR